MADSTWKVDNTFVPKFIPSNLKWYEHDGLDTWYLRNKCNEFLEDTDSHFKNRKIVNFDIINNGETKQTLKQYNTIDHDEIKKYPVKEQEQIMSSIFRNANRKDMLIKKETIDTHFNRTFVPPKGRGKFIKKLRGDMYASCWQYLIKNMLDNSYTFIF